MSRFLPVAAAFALTLVAGFSLGYLASGEGREAPPVEPPAEPVPGERSLELAEIRRVSLRLSATSEVRAQLAEAEQLLRNRLAAAGLTIAAPGEPSDATVTAHLDSHHFRAFDAHGVAVELHLVGRHQVKVGGELRLIPHDIWQSDTTRLVHPDSIPREVVQSLDELIQHMVSAIVRARAAPR